MKFIGSLLLINAVVTCALTLAMLYVDGQGKAFSWATTAIAIAMLVICFGPVVVFHSRHQLNFIEMGKPSKGVGATIFAVVMSFVYLGCFVYAFKLTVYGK